MYLHSRTTNKIYFCDTQCMNMVC